MALDARFQLDERFAEGEAGPSSASVSGSDAEAEPELSEAEDDELALDEDMDAEGFAGPSKVVKPLTPEALKAFNAAQEKTGVVYISRIPPGMRPTKVRHLMGQHGEIGRVYLQQEDAKRAYLRRKHTSTKKAHFTEGWVEFKDKKVARAVAGLLNAQPIGGKKGTRWRDDVWTMKYLPRFKWDMLTEQIAHEAAQRSAQLRVELAQSRSEQREYLKNVELSRVLDKRAERKKLAAEKTGQPVDTLTVIGKREREGVNSDGQKRKKKPKVPDHSLIDAGAGRESLRGVFDSIF